MAREKSTRHLPIASRIDKLLEQKNNNKYVERVFDVDIRALSKILKDNGCLTFSHITLCAYILREVLLWITYKGTKRKNTKTGSIAGWINAEWFVKNRDWINLKETNFKRTVALLKGIGLLDHIRKIENGGSKTFYYLTEEGLDLMGVYSLNEYYKYLTNEYYVKT